MTEGYTGRKLNKYIWIPKSKTDLREYREFLRICSIVQKRNGYFSDITIGNEMVKLRAIVDRDNTANSYIEKYEKKKTADQSYVSNARMLLRILRWMGLVTKDYNPGIRGKFYLTPLGEMFTDFHGPFPSTQHGVSELELFERSFAGLRYYCVNDDIAYRNIGFKQRVFLNMIRFLDNLEHASHYELALSALVLRNESPEEIEEKINRIIECRENGKDVRWLMGQYDMDCEIKSTVTGIYDGPKVLLSFARQLGLVEDLDLSKNTGLKNTYKRMYKDCGFIGEYSAKKITKITAYGKEFLKKYSERKLVWFDSLSKPESVSALILLCLADRSFQLKNLGKLDLTEIDLKNYPELFSIEGEKVIVNGNLDFDLYRDVPYENRRSVINNIQMVDKHYFEKEKMLDAGQQKMFIPKEYPTKRCINCYQGKCCFYRENFNAYGGRDRYPWRVCPENLLSYDDEGILHIDSKKCVGCGLCALRCSFDGVKYDSTSHFFKLENEVDELNRFTELGKKAETARYEKKFLMQKSIINKKDIPNLVAHFIAAIDNCNYRWDKDACYTYVRNVFRTFGVDAVYSGSGGMKTRSDVTIEHPFVAVSEVKSPAESPINLKAVRQAVDAAAQKETKLAMAIGIKTHPGAVDQELKYRKSYNTHVLLLEIKYLCFLSFVGEFICFTPDSLKRLISDNIGEFGVNELKAFIKKECSICETSMTPEEAASLIELTFNR